MRRRDREPARLGSDPNTCTDPAEGRNRSTNMRIVVDFPAPFGPRKPSTSPVSTSRDNRSIANVAPKRFVTSSQHTAADTHKHDMRATAHSGAAPERSPRSRLARPHCRPGMMDHGTNPG